MKTLLPCNLELSTLTRTRPMLPSMLHLAVIFLILTSFEARAGFNRLWVGHRLEGMSATTFIEGLNRIFFEETIQVGKGRGLLSYQPYVTSMVPGLPDELALVVYESEEKYQVIRSTPEGQNYGDLHWDYFNRTNSKSTVSAPFQGTLEDEKAFEINPRFTQWQDSPTQVSIYAREGVDLRSLARTFAELRRDPDVRNSIVLLKGPWIIEYRSLRPRSDFRPLPLRILETKRLLQRSLRGLRTQIGRSQGVNFSF